MNKVDANSVRALVRRLNVFQAWRLGEPPFEQRTDIFSEADVNHLLDEVVDCLTNYALSLENQDPLRLSELPLFKNTKPLTESELLKLAAHESSLIKAAGVVLPSGNPIKPPLDTQNGFIVDG